MPKHLPTSDPVQRLQCSVQAKGKAEPGYRFFSLLDNVYRGDILREVYRRCYQNGGAPGMEGESFEKIESGGVDQWLGNLQEELRTKSYRPKPLLRVWIPKSSGGERPLGIPTVRYRVVQMAMVLVIAPIFESDLCDEQMGFRPGRDAKMAVRLAHSQVRQKGRQEVVDADLRDYFNTIPHGQLLKSLRRRIADGQILSVLSKWLRAPIEERTPAGYTQRTTQAKDTGRGTPRGSPISPLFANVYFRRFLLAWTQLGYWRRCDSVVVNYADDLVICCRPGNGQSARAAMTKIMEKIGLSVNEQKTRVIRVPGESFDFLGYTIGRFYGRGGKPYIGARPSRKAILRIMREIHEQTSSRWTARRSPKPGLRCSIRSYEAGLGTLIKAPVLSIYHKLQLYTDGRLRKWLMRRRQKRGTGYCQFPHEYLYKKLGLFQLPQSREDLSKAKAEATEMRATRGKAAGPVRRAGTGNGATEGNEAPAL